MKTNSPGLGSCFREIKDERQKVKHVDAKLIMSERLAGLLINEPKNEAESQEVIKQIFYLILTDDHMDRGRHYRMAEMKNLIHHLNRLQEL